MRFKQCYCILAFLLRGIDINDYLAFDRIQPTIFRSMPLSPFRARVSSILVEQVPNLHIFPIDRISDSIRMLLVFSCLPCLGTGSHALHVSSERIVINMAASPLTSAVAVELLSIVIISVGVKCKRASRVRSLGKEVPNFLPETRCPITTLLIDLW